MFVRLAKLSAMELARDENMRKSNVDFLPSVEKTSTSARTVASEPLNVSALWSTTQVDKSADSSLAFFLLTSTRVLPRALCPFLVNTTSLSLCVQARDLEASYIYMALSPICF
eukprot:TRINITY_DN48508_c0_g1_i1.p1 TRINITY_DN48508_c0_g1~~TRINITY_DN48508_c0_g1_i1.p1  ORF type:complete len:113 (+),score=7.38 TRINITY_DN48508_c0_g1_i1:335-673(+)